MTEAELAEIRAERLAQIKAWAETQHPGDGTEDVPDLAEDVFFLLEELQNEWAEVERLRGVVEAAKALLLQSELKEDAANYEAWYEVCVPEWEDLRAALAALEEGE